MQAHDSIAHSNAGCRVVLLVLILSPYRTLI